MMFIACTRHLAAVNPESLSLHLSSGDTAGHAEALELDCRQFEDWFTCSSPLPLGSRPSASLPKEQGVFQGPYAWQALDFHTCWLCLVKLSKAFRSQPKSYAFYDQKLLISLPPHNLQLGHHHMEIKHHCIQEATTIRSRSCRC